MNRTHMSVNVKAQLRPQLKDSLAQKPLTLPRILSLSDRNTNKFGTHIRKEGIDHHSPRNNFIVSRRLRNHRIYQIPPEPQKDTQRSLFEINAHGTVRMLPVTEA